MKYVCDKINIQGKSNGQINKNRIINIIFTIQIDWVCSSEKYTHPFLYKAINLHYPE